MRTALGGMFKVIHGPWSKCRLRTLRVGSRSFSYLDIANEKKRDEKGFKMSKSLVCSGLKCLLDSVHGDGGGAGEGFGTVPHRFSPLRSRSSHH